LISAIVLAAGKSSRMGVPKMTLPWGNSTVIGKVIITIQEAGLSNIQVVTGSNQKEVEDVLRGFPVEFIFNPNFTDGDMITSVQEGLRSLRGKSEAALFVLGDQPQTEPHTIKVIMECYYSTRCKIVVPSYQMHRGHPWLLEKSFWDEVLALETTLTMRDYLNRHQDKIKYVNVNTPSIIQDLDTMEDYKSFSP
jgi:molybdenum cofactor cytidylyltransferase